MDSGSLDPSEMSFFADLQKILYSPERRLPKRLRRVCAVDAAYDADRVAAVATLFVEGRKAEETVYLGRCTFPYVTGLFYLREGPSAVEAVRRLKVRPELVCFDAQGKAHPRSAGLATVCGMVLGIPSVGISKSLLVGEVTQDGGLGKIIYRGKVVGFVTGVGRRVRYWSPGFSVSTAQLRSLIVDQGTTLLESMAESDRRARLEIRSARPSLG